jgi:hypothetical protein
MKRYALILLALIAATSVGIWLLAWRSRPPAPAPLVRAERRPAPTTAADPPLVASPAPLIVSPQTRGAPADSQPADDLPPLIADPAKARERVRALTATFNEAYLDELARYLAHPSADVRAATLNALLLFDDPQAAPFLRAAAEVVEKDPRSTGEAVALREAADLLSTPRQPGEFRPAPTTPDQPSTKQTRPQ